MSGQPYIDGDTIAQCRDAIRFGGRTLEKQAALLHLDCELLGRLLQLPAQPVTSASQQDAYLWSVDRLDGVL